MAQSPVSIVTKVKDYAASERSRSVRADGKVPHGLLDKLYKMLDIHQMMELFIAAVRSAVACDGIEYHMEDMGLDLLDGEFAKHCCSYRIGLEKEFLGEITFTRRHVFLDSEFFILENLVSALVNPLRNALQYHKAIHSAHNDPLTGLKNRNLFDETLEQEMQRARRYGSPFSLLVIDLDHFKRINDQHGHLAGDRVLVELAKRLAHEIRGSDQLFRYGGEEFVALLTNTSISDARIVAERIRKAAHSRPCVYEDVEICCTLSIGVAMLLAGDSISDLFERADKAVYKAKTLGRNQIQLADSQHMRD